MYKEQVIIFALRIVYIGDIFHCTFRQNFTSLMFYSCDMTKIERWTLFFLLIEKEYIPHIGPNRSQQ